MASASPKRKVVPSSVSSRSTSEGNAISPPACTVILAETSSGRRQDRSPPAWTTECVSALGERVRLASPPTVVSTKPVTLCNTRSPPTAPKRTSPSTLSATASPPIRSTVRSPSTLRAYRSPPISSKVDRPTRRRLRSPPTVFIINSLVRPVTLASPPTCSTSTRAPTGRKIRQPERQVTLI